MGRFSGVGGVTTNQGGLYFLEGDYLVEIDEVKMIQNRKKQDTFIIAAKVLESTNDQRKPGCKPSQVMVLRSDIIETILANIKQFAGAALEIDDPDNYEPEDGTSADEFWDSTLEYLVSDEQPLKGQKMRLNCSNIKTQAGKDFTKHVWGEVVEAAA